MSRSKSISIGLPTLFLCGVFLWSCRPSSDPTPSSPSNTPIDPSGGNPSGDKTNLLKFKNPNSVSLAFDTVSNQATISWDPTLEGINPAAKPSYFAQVYQSGKTVDKDSPIYSCPIAVDGVSTCSFEAKNFSVNQTYFAVARVSDNLKPRSVGITAPSPEVTYLAPTGKDSISFPHGASPSFIEFSNIDKGKDNYLPAYTVSWPAAACSNNQVSVVYKVDILEGDQVVRSCIQGSSTAVEGTSCPAVEPLDNDIKIGNKNIPFGFLPVLANNAAYTVRVTAQAKIYDPIKVKPENVCLPATITTAFRPVPTQGVAELVFNAGGKFNKTPSVNIKYNYDEDVSHNAYLCSQKSDINNNNYLHFLKDIKNIANSIRCINDGIPDGQTQPLPIDDKTVGTANGLGSVQYTFSDFPKCTGELAWKITNKDELHFLGRGGQFTSSPKQPITQTYILGNNCPDSTSVQLTTTNTDASEDENVRKFPNTYPKYHFDVNLNVD